MSYILRSLLFVPGNSERMMHSAARTNADAIIFDLEDSVVDSSKQQARNVINKILKTDLFDKFHIFIRLNDRQSSHLQKDVSQIINKKITGFIFPKSFSKEDILYFEEVLAKAESAAGFASGTFKILPLLETASAILHAEEICLASQRVIAVVFGSEDFCADIRGIHDETHVALLVPRVLCVLAARAAGVIPIDASHINVHDLDDLEANLKLGRNLGFEGKLLLHPKEIELTHKYFSPSKQEYENAEKVIRLSREAVVNNIRIAIIGDTFIGPPILRQAEYTISRFNQIKEWELSRRK